jgi:hypothetical protein
MKNFKYILMFFVLVSIVACEEVLFEQDISEESVTLIAPSNNTEIEANSVRFNWTRVEGATDYEIQIATPNFANANQLVLNTITDSTFYQVQLIENDYEWRIRGHNSGYATPFSSAKFKVVPIQDFSANTVILLSPSNGLITNEEVHNLKWEEVPDATQYRIQVLDENGEPIQSETTTETNMDITFPEGSLQWQVRAERDSEYTLYSARDILVDTTPPNTPTLTEPADEAILTDPSVSFNWTRTLIEGSVESDSIYVYRDPNLTDLLLKDEATAPYGTTLDSDQTYYWFMKAFDEAGNESDDSDVFSFTINP